MDKRDKIFIENIIGLYFSLKNDSYEQKFKIDSIFDSSSVKITWKEFYYENGIVVEVKNGKINYAFYPIIQVLDFLKEGSWIIDNKQFRIKKLKNILNKIKN